MGIAQAMSENMKKNMQTQMKFQKEIMVLQRQTQMATQIAMGRQRLRYYIYFYCTSVPLACLGAFHKKNPALLGPIIPLTFILAFQYDMCYGEMMERVRDEADGLLTEHKAKFLLPKHSGIVSEDENKRIVGYTVK